MEIYPSLYITSYISRLIALFYAYRDYILCCLCRNMFLSFVASNYLDHQDLEILIRCMMDYGLPGGDKADNDEALTTTEPSTSSSSQRVSSSLRHHHHATAFVR